MRLFCAIVFIGLAATGCAKQDRDQGVAAVLAEDPSFREVLDKHRRLLNRLDAHDRELELKRLAVERAVTQLRADLEATQRDVEDKKARVRQEIEPDRTALLQALGESRSELREKGMQRSAVGKEMSRLRKASEASKLLTESERSAKRAELALIEQDAHRLAAEIAILHRRVDLLQFKLRLLEW